MAGSTSSTGSSTGSGTIVNGHYWGLASGLDVDSIVTSLVSDDQGKIDKQQQSEQKLQWKQQGYRDIIDKLNTFESSYLTFGATTSMAASSMYCSYTANSSDSDISVLANSDATGVTQYVNVLKTATTASIAGNSLQSKITGKSLSSIVGATLSNKSFSMTIDDATKTITFTPSDITSHTTDGVVDVKKMLQDKIDAAFGVGKVTVDTNDGTATGKLTLSNNTTADGGAYANDAITVDAGSPNDALAALGFSSDSSNRLDQKESLGTFLGTPSDISSMTVTINGKQIKLDKSKPVADALSAINNSGAGVTASYNANTDRFSITSNESGAAGSFTLGATPADDTSTLLSSMKVSYTGEVKGGDAQIQISNSSDFSAGNAANITTYTRSANNFTINGVSYNIGNVAVDATTPANNVSKISFTTDSSKLQKGIQDFISAYNTLITDIHTQINTEPDSDYPPLTDAQKSTMTSTEITQWNTKAQEGMLFGDDTLQGVLDEMRNDLYKSVTLSDGSTYSLYDLGVTTSDNADDYGKLEIKPEDLSTFQNACNTQASKIKQLFTKTSSIALNISAKADPVQQQKRTNEEGLSDRLNDAVLKSAGRVNNTYGSIVQIAGTKSLNQYDNTIYKNIKDISDNITTMKASLKDKKNRLYAQFTKLETFMSKANAQSSELSSLGS